MTVVEEDVATAVTHPRILESRSTISGWKLISSEDLQKWMNGWLSEISYIISAYACLAGSGASTRSSSISGVAGLARNKKQAIHSYFALSSGGSTGIL